MQHKAMASNNSRLKQALKLLNAGVQARLADAPPDPETYTIAYDGREYAVIEIQPDGSVYLRPCRPHLVPPEQLALVLQIAETLL